MNKAEPPEQMACFQSIYNLNLYIFYVFLKKNALQLIYIFSFYWMWAFCLIIRDDANLFSHFKKNIKTFIKCLPYVSMQVEVTEINEPLSYFEGLHSLEGVTAI